MFDPYYLICQLAMNFVRYDKMRGPSRVRSRSPRPLIKCLSQGKIIDDPRQKLNIIQVSPTFASFQMEMPPPTRQPFSNIMNSNPYLKNSRISKVNDMPRYGSPDARYQLVSSYQPAYYAQYQEPVETQARRPSPYRSNKMIYQQVTPNYHPAYQPPSYHIHPQNYPVHHNHQQHQHQHQHQHQQTPYQSPLGQQIHRQAPPPPNYQATPNLQCVSSSRRIIPQRQSFCQPIPQRRQQQRIQKIQENNEIQYDQHEDCPECRAEAQAIAANKSKTFSIPIQITPGQDIVLNLKEGVDW